MNQKATETTLIEKTWAHDFFLCRAVFPEDMSDKKRKKMLKLAYAEDDIHQFTQKQLIKLKTALHAIDDALQKRKYPSNVEVKKCQTIGSDGLFATKTIAANTPLGVYSGEYIFEKDLSSEEIYLFGIGKGCSVNAGPCGSHARFVNHTTKKYANATAIKIVLDEGEMPQIVLITTKTVKKGEQILFDYGDEYYAALEISPIILKPSDT